MQLRELGKSGIKVSALGFGAGGFWGMPAFSESVATSLVDIAIEEGITTFDTGPNYSNGNAEGRLGRALGARVHDVFLGTKVGSIFENGRNRHDYSTQSMRSSFEASLRRLGRDHVDLLQFHGMPAPLTAQATDFLLEEKHRGRARLVGVSTGAADVDKALALSIFDVLMLPYNVIERTEEGVALEKCGRAGVGVLVKSPLAQTLYSNRLFKVRSLADLWYLARAVKNFRWKIVEGRKYGFLTENGTGHDVALQFVLENPNVSAAMIGTTRAENLRANCMASEISISKSMLERILTT